jgi:hypothetical protein
MGVCARVSGSGSVQMWVKGAGVWKVLDGDCLGVDQGVDTSEALRTGL